MKLTETDIKYLAGLLDADGCLTFHFSPHRDRWNVSLKLVLQQSLSIDKEGKLIKWLGSHAGFVQSINVSKDNPKWSDANRWTVTSNKELNMILPRLTKHMVVKAKHWQNLLDKYNSIYGKSVTTDEKEELKEFSKLSRDNVGPLKSKSHPTWAWAAGYLDGDGCYHIRKRKKNWGIYHELLVKVAAHDKDVCSLELLHKAFNGNLKKNNYENTYSWTRNLGNKDKSFAIKFLRKMHKHSRLKKHKIESMLHHHLQRLNESASTEDAIV